ncbi:hypothetical protein ACT3SZ_15580 [Corynebacterium sp. AOP40-9SA-29]|uniref:hypothetical protein n=1 Tax=Corynebacterium sp. AOP40-9SA-29 TaxID=3457677 RepID=UPI004033F44E
MTADATAPRIRISRAGHNEWEVCSAWGATVWDTWPEAIAEARRLAGTVRTAMARRAQDSDRADGTCAYRGCHKDAHYVYPGRGFLFCPKHGLTALQVLENPTITPRPWPNYVGAK